MSTAEKIQQGIKPKTPQIQELINSTKTLILATIDADNRPTASYAPYVYLDKSFYVLVSFMAKHTRNLRDRKKVSLMLIEDESATRQVYARDRITIDSEAEFVETASAEYTRVVEALEQRHGKIVKVLSNLDDFILFKFKPQQGSYVNGFGSAYFVDSDLQVIEHRKGAHGAQNNN